MKKAEEITKIQKSEIIDDKEHDSAGISYDTIGTTLQALNVQLDKGEKVYAESGKMSWMTSNIKMKTKSRGISKMFSRVITGESLFVNEFEAVEDTGVVTFSTDQAGKIIPIELDNNNSVVFQRGSFLCAETNVDLKIAFTKRISAGLFGGKGFVLQKVTGQGIAHLIADGEVVMYELEAGQELIVDQGNLVAFDSSVDFDIQTVQGGLFNWVFGGEGIFTGLLRGPGKVWLQTRKNNLVSSAYQGQYNQQRNASNPIGCIISIIISVGVFGCILSSIFLSLIENS